MLEFASEATAYDTFVAQYSDGLPIVLPTPERVDAMLAGTREHPDDVIGLVYPSGNAATIRDAATNAVMAGAEPRQLRTILAALEAIVDERFNLNGLQSTTHCATPLVIVSGPHAFEAGLSAGNNVLGNGVRGNLSVGRAIRLVLTNVGGGRPGETDMAVQGTPAKISFCVAERLDVGFPSLAERQGGDASETSVTVMAADGPVTVSDHRSSTPERLLGNVADTLRHMGSLNAAVPGPAALLLAPQHARVVARAGWTIGDVQRFLFENARNPVGRLQAGGEWDPLVPLYSIARFGDPDDPETRVPVLASPESLIVAVTGGDTGGFSAVVTSWPASAPLHRFIDVDGSYGRPARERTSP
ncbi:MAG: hypothetical protein IAI48_03405 [Candidatus Eremiobacteraeota bacterium]|nr:hypothetical protein [Candidatus Eremiobacteraeota bacterium]